ncbi:MAG: type VII toxin-antitoxin system MntA family adenylyltransferase antitoxin, partial [Dictyoglomus sp.]
EENKNIIALFIFGSFGTEEENYQSDIDLAILYEDYIPLKEELNIETEIVKILEREDIDILNLNKAPLDLKMEVISEGDLIYCKNEIKLSDFKERVFDFYADYEPVLRKFYEDYIEGIRNERSR